MLSLSKLNPSLISKYEVSEYHVMSAKPFILEMGNKSDGIEDLARRLRVDCVAFITAHNPYSRIVSEKENAKRNRKLKRELDKLDLTIVVGCGQDLSKSWKEDSFVVFGLGLEEAKKLGVKYQQNAIVWCGVGAIPELVLLRQPEILEDLN